MEGLLSMGLLRLVCPLKNRFHNYPPLVKAMRSQIEESENIIYFFFKCIYKALNLSTCEDRSTNTKRKTQSKSFFSSVTCPLSPTPTATATDPALLTSPLCTVNFQSIGPLGRYEHFCLKIV